MSFKSLKGCFSYIIPFSRQEQGNRMGWNGKERKRNLVLKQLFWNQVFLSLSLMKPSSFSISSLSLIISLVPWLLLEIEKELLLQHKL